MDTYKSIIKDLLKKTTYDVSNDCKELIYDSYQKAEQDTSKYILETILENIEEAHKNKSIICQSPGYGTVYIKHGTEIFIENIEE